MNHHTIDLGSGNSLVADAGAAAIYFADGSYNNFDLNGLGQVAEWLAVAWENVAGEEYKPVTITERRYVAQDSIDMSSDPGPGTEPYGRERILERDCE